MKKYLILVLIVLLIGALSVGVLAGKNGQAGKSNIAHLYLYEKDPDSWDIVEDGAWGKMKYNLSGETFDFVFNGHGLDADMDYTLIVYYGEDWPGTGICLGNGMTNSGGEIHIANSVDTGSLEDAKIWLVRSDDQECDFGMTDWNPKEYLFEYDLITFNDTDEQQLQLFELNKKHQKLTSELIFRGQFLYGM